jgi:hypothetical protein
MMTILAAEIILIDEISYKAAGGSSVKSPFQITRLQSPYRRAAYP